MIYIVVTSEYFEADNSYNTLDIEAFDNYVGAYSYFNFMCYNRVDEYKSKFNMKSPDLFLLQAEDKKTGLLEYFIVPKKSMNVLDSNYFYVELYEKNLHSSYEDAI